ncbi:DUF3806 domain-containing protein [Cognatiyoonia sp. IB215182]|uniref:DUF3806 domain-containing protein n=1 Tax=Cognatiyoonia sp. IB215182 TaxID=3097353 RepID=UPI002A17DAA7|nr:DUF3806 domain-containing protein [Cognatiyoonia sp. IB215182]MDX8353179.1 DUF3806 domain-containing protein [Cognatiyoonia sp. IB215182]
MDQRVSQLSQQDKDHLDAQRAIVSKYVADSSLERFETAAGKLGTLRALLDANTFSKEQTYELQSMGVVLGDALCIQLGMEWAVVEDDYGRDPAVRYRGTSVIVFPQTMISKRIEDDVDVDIFDLFNWTVDKVNELIEEEVARTATH